MQWGNGLCHSRSVDAVQGVFMDGELAVELETDGTDAAGNVQSTRDRSTLGQCLKVLMGTLGCS